MGSWIRLRRDRGPLALALQSFDPEWFRTRYGLPAEMGSAALVALYLAEVAQRRWCPNRWFDEDWYRNRYEDVEWNIVAGTLVCGFQHFVTAGRSEGREPRSTPIEALWYLANTAGASDAVARRQVGSALEHYLLLGAQQGAAPLPGFDEAWYLGRYPEAVEAIASGIFLSGFEHWEREGVLAGYHPAPDFDPAAYRCANPDVELQLRLGLVRDPFSHWVSAGRREGRPTRPPEPDGPEPPPERDWLRFDPKWYLETYPEAAAEIVAENLAGANEHYARVGQAARSSPNGAFDERYYLETYPDVAAEVQEGRLSSGFAHFVRSGYREGKQPNRLIVGEWYRWRYPDVAQLLREGAFRDEMDHYLECGARERRDPNPAFSEAEYLEAYPDAAEAVRRGRWISGYHHFTAIGAAAGYRPNSWFEEAAFLTRNLDIAAAVERGEIASGFEHVARHGLAPERAAVGQEEPEHRQAAVRMSRLRLRALLESPGGLVLADAAVPQVSVLLVVHNAAHWTAECLESLAAVADELPFEVLVWDNASTDQTAELLRRVVGLTIVTSPTNVGFLVACNQLAARARGRHLLFLNNDTVVLRGSLTAAVARLESRLDIGAVGGRLVGSDGLAQEAGSVVWSDATTCGFGLGLPAESGILLMPREVDYVAGAFLLTPADVFRRVEGFDPQFAPAYYEDADYCFRLRRIGLVTVYEPRSVVIHHGQGSLRAAWQVNGYLATNLPRFARVHCAELASAPPPGTTHVAAREPYRGRLLFVDDRPPTAVAGSGFPRARAIVDALRGLGWWVTHCSTVPGSAEGCWGDWGLEFIELRALVGLADFVEQRLSFYDAIVVSRLHNLASFLENRSTSEALQSLPLIYDAEALEADRRAQGQPAHAPDRLSPEIGLVAAAEEVWAVSERDARVLAAAGRPVHVVGHGVLVPASPPGPEGREGLLFLGRLTESGSPNVAGLAWFCREVLPEIERLLGFQVPLTVVGRFEPNLLPVVPNLTALGPVADLAEHCDRARVFVAPAIGAAAGIPLKVLEAAANGLPVVASSILATQLQWRDNVELLDGGSEDPRQFAAAVVSLLGDDGLWRRVQSASRERVRVDWSVDALTGALRQALGREDRWAGLRSERRVSRSNQEPSRMEVAPGAIVLGMHRSGTSLLASLLKAASLWSGHESQLLPPQEDNTDGFFERRDVAGLNDQLLAAAGESWDSPFEVAPNLESDRREPLGRQFSRVIQTLGALPWLLKDPRLSLTWPWLGIEELPVVAIVALRHPLQVARSLARRNGFPIDLGLAIWEAYYVRLSRALAGRQQLIVDYDELCRDPVETWGHLADALKRELPDTLVSIPDQMLRVLVRAPALGERSGRDELPAEIAEWYTCLRGGALPTEVPRLSARSRELLDRHRPSALAVARLTKDLAELHAEYEAAAADRKFLRHRLRKMAALSGEIR